MAGPWGDCSPHLHKLLRFFAEERVIGWVLVAGALGKTVGEVRRSAWVIIVRSKQVCLLECLAFLFSGAEVAVHRW